MKSMLIGENIEVPTACMNCHSKSCVSDSIEDNLLEHWLTLGKRVFKKLEIDRDREYLISELKNDCKVCYVLQAKNTWLRDKIQILEME